MGSEIRTSLGAVLAAQGTARQGLDAYCALRLQNLSGVLPVAGSADHDGRLARSLADALASYRRAVEADARAIGSVHEGLASADGALAAGMGAG